MFILCRVVLLSSELFDIINSWSPLLGCMVEMRVVGVLILVKQVFCCFRVLVCGAFAALNNVHVLYLATQLVFVHSANMGSKWHNFGRR